MPEQLIYTSAPRGLVAGRSGHCTVARSPQLREALMLPLEKWSYYQHLSLTRGQERPIYSCRILDFRGSVFHVLSKIQDAGVDFTGRTNFVAHHLVFSPEEIRTFPSPPIILRDWKGWVTNWAKDPQLIEAEDLSLLPTINDAESVREKAWQQHTGEAFNGYGLLEAREGSVFNVDNLGEDQILSLFAESLALLEIRDKRGDFRATAWQYTFTTSLQEHDTPPDFRWRCVYSDNPAFKSLAGPDCNKLSDIRASARVTDEEKELASNGPKKPEFETHPRGGEISLGEKITLQAKAKGVPSPQYQWYKVLDGEKQAINGETRPDIQLSNLPCTEIQYLVRASNSRGPVDSQVAKVKVNPKPVEKTHGPKWSSNTNPDSHRPSPLKLRQSTPSPDGSTQYNSTTTAEDAKPSSRWKQFAFAVSCFLIVIGGLYFLSKYSSGGESISKVDGLPIVAPDNKSPVTPVANKPTIRQRFLGRWFPRSGSKTQPKASNGGSDGGSGDGQPSPSSENSGGQNAARAAKMEEKKQTLNSNREQINVPSDDWKVFSIGKVSDVSVNSTSAPPLNQWVFRLTAKAAGITEKEDNYLFVGYTGYGTNFIVGLDLNPKTLPQTDFLFGVMVRESEKPNTAFCFLGATSSNIIAYHRDSNGKLSPKTHDFPKNSPEKTIRFMVAMPKGVPTLTYLLDGKNYNPSGLSVELTKIAPTFVGLAISSGTSPTKVDATFNILKTE